MLDAAELAEIRTEAERTVLVQSAQILRNTGQSAAGDNLGGGGLLGDWEPFGVVVSCRLKVHRPKAEEVVAGQVRSLTMFEARFPVGTDLLVTDRVDVLNGDYPGTYSVASVTSGQAEMVLLYCWLTLVEA